MTRRVLIVSPHFPPINAPDHQRVRMALPYLAELGWEATVLCVRPDRVEGVLDPVLDATVPDEVERVAVGALPQQATRLLGVGGLALRAGPFLGRAGARLLASGRFDLAFFSTTIFPTMTLGPTWRRRFGTPYLLDFQDPWLSDYYDRPGAPPPPGGRLKYAFARWRARRGEGPAVRSASHTISVSPRYPEVLRERYPGLPADRFTVLPFGAPERDFALLDSPAGGEVTQGVFDPADGRRHWVYVGRGGRDMAPALRILFGALREVRASDAALGERLRLHFVGTSYARAAAAEKTIEPLARETGVGDLVEERTGRVPYFEAIRLLRDADAILLIGSDDPAYTASKLYPCVLARRPMLALVHEASSVAGIVAACRAGDCVTFASGAAPEARIPATAAIVRRLLDARSDGMGEAAPDTDWAAFAPYTARAMTERLVGCFERALADAVAR